MATIPEADPFFAADRAAWREWLAAHHGSASVVWLLLHKKHVGEPSVTYDEAVEEALCWAAPTAGTSSATRCGSRHASRGASGARATSSASSA